MCADYLAPEQRGLIPKYLFESAGNGFSLITAFKGVKPAYLTVVGQFEKQHALQNRERTGVPRRAARLGTPVRFRFCIEPPQKAG